VLAYCLAVRGKAFAFTMSWSVVDSGSWPKLRAHVKLSKNVDYLVDNLDVFILSEVK